MSDPIETNRRHWDAWTDLHVGSSSYDVEGFLAGKDPFDPLVNEALGDVCGKRVLHLQCHFGIDTLNLVRRGAVATGVDFSPKSIAAARDLAVRAGLEAEFVLSTVEDLPDHLDGEFDLVFTSWGVLPWLPELRSWAETIAHFLAPDGTFVLVEEHPFVWMFENERDDDRLVPEWSYFDGEPRLWKGTGSYAEPDAPVDHESYQSMHKVSAILGAVRGVGLHIVEFVEHSLSGYQGLPFLVPAGDGLWSVPEGFPGIPLSFTLKATR